jgi:serine O-acetyltransferase
MTSLLIMIKKDILRTADLIQGGKLKKIIGCCGSPGVHAVIILRFGQWLLKQKGLFRIILEPIYIFLFYMIRSTWGIEIPREAEIGEGFYIGHYGGIIVASSVKIGKNVDISHQVTIGVSGQGEKRGCPTIGDYTYIAPGAKIFGKIKIGNYVKIGANAVIYKDIPDNAIVVSYPGFKIISYKGNHPTT